MMYDVTHVSLAMFSISVGMSELRWLTRDFKEATEYIFCKITGDSHRNSDILTVIPNTHFHVAAWTIWEGLVVPSGVIVAFVLLSNLPRSL
jgi:hypothetical protein